MLIGWLILKFEIQQTARVYYDGMTPIGMYNKTGKNSCAVSTMECRALPQGSVHLELEAGSILVFSRCSSSLNGGSPTETSFLQYRTRLHPDLQLPCCGAFPESQLLVQCAEDKRVASANPNVVALIIRMGLGAILYYNYNQEPPKTIF